jgi:hypothetical protein
MKTIIIKGIDETLYKKFKMICLENEVSLKDAISELMKKAVTTTKKEGDK